MKQLFLHLCILLATSQFFTQVQAEENKNINISADLYASHTHIFPYKGYGDDISGTVYLKYSDFALVPFARYINTEFYYLNDGNPANTNYTSDTRTAAGLGLDLIVTKNIKFRFVSYYVTNRLSGQNYQQESLGLIYNDYVDLGALELNNYLEAFLIPRYSNTHLDSFLRIQALKTLYFHRTENNSSAWYPFAQVKIKAYDQALFGISGNNSSAGLGFKYFNRLSENSSIAFVLEGHSLIHQSQNFNSDWNQIFAALQLLYN